MAKKKKAAPKKKRVPKAVKDLREKLQGPELGNHTGVVAQRITQLMRDETGDDFVTNVGEARALLLGLPVPSLAFEYMLRMNILPLGKMMMLVGIEKVGKSGFFFEIVRWFRKHQGFGVLLEHESKFSADWASSIIGWDEPDALTHVPCDSIEGWQKAMTKSVDWVKKEMIGDPRRPKDVKPGKTWPFVMGVDSIMGKSTDATQKKIDEAGHSQQHYANEAGRITDYMRFIPQKINRWPFFMVGVNHLKPSRDPDTGVPVRATAGGRGVQFQESLELELGWAKGGRKASRIRLVDREGMRIRISCENNSYAPAGRQITVTIWSWQEEYENALGQEDWRPVVVWDWHGATVQMLLNECANGTATDAKAIKEIVNIQKVSNQSLFYARALGISKSDPVPADVIGKMIYEDKEMMKDLRKILKIRTYAEFQPGVDLDDQLFEQKKRLAGETVKVRKRRPPPPSDEDEGEEPAAPKKKRPVKKKKRSAKTPASEEAAPSQLTGPPKSKKKRKARPRGRA
jgi:hypothetical protein